MRIRISIWSLLTVITLTLFTTPVAAQAKITEPLESLAGNGKFEGFDWQPSNASMLAVAAGNDVLLYSAELQLITTFHGHTDEVLSLSWSPDGTKLASAGKDQTVRLWDITGNSLAILADFDDWVVRVSWSPFGDRLAVTFVESTRTFTDGSGIIFYQTAIWDIRDISKPQLLYKLPHQVDQFGAVAWKPDGDQFATAGNIPQVKFAVQIWSGSDGKRQTIISGFYDTPIYSAKWSSNDVLAIASDTSVYLANPSTGEIAEFLAGHDDLVTDLSWNLDGIRLASGSNDGTIRIWDTSSLQTTALIENHEKVFQVAWSPNGNLLASLDSLNNLKIWDVAGT